MQFVTVDDALIESSCTNCDDTQQHRLATCFDVVLSSSSRWILVKHSQPQIVIISVCVYTHKKKLFFFPFFRDFEWQFWKQVRTMKISEGIGCVNTSDSVRLNVVLGRSTSNLCLDVWCKHQHDLLGVICVSHLSRDLCCVNLPDVYRLLVRGRRRNSNVSLSLRQEGKNVNHRESDTNFTTIPSLRLWLRLREI